MAVARGQRVAAGAPLFTLDARSPAAVEAQAQAQLAQATAEAAQAAANEKLQEANLAAAKAQADNARRDSARYAALARAATGAVSTQETDRAATAARTAEDQQRAAEAQRQTAQAQLLAAQAGARRAAAAIADAQARLSQMSSRAPAAGRIEEVFFQAGEWAPANQPLVSLIPDAKVKLRFYAPEADLVRYPVGARVRFSCDGCKQVRAATVAYVSPRPEYTPPLIYSRKARERMMFLIEALPDGPAALTPGQPVDILRAAAAK
jgi:HlyD family secretion protein